MIEKVLGKISSVYFGYVGYQDMQFGLSLSFSMGSSGIGTTIAESWVLDMDCSKHAKWTEQDREAGFGRTMREINSIMQKAKVKEIHELKNKPVEIIIENNSLKSWRILEEVL